MEKKRIIDVDEKPSLSVTFPLSLQHLFAMFGATVLVPFLFKVNPATSLLFNGIGTLIYLVVAKGKIPAYLGSSFAFISPVFAIMAIPAMGGYAAAQSGFIAFGIFFVLMSLLIKYTGINWVDVIFPPAAMGAIVAVIGLELAPVATNMAGFTGDNFVRLGITQNSAITVSVFTVVVIFLGSVLFRGFLSVIPILIGVVAGYLFSLYLGIIDFKIIEATPWFEVPSLYFPSFNPGAIIIIMPAALVVLAEHIGHLIVTGNIIGRDFMKNPGLHRSLLGDGISNIISGFFGATPNTTYGENIGVMAITRVYSVRVIGFAAVIAIIISFFGKVAAIIRTIPEPVMGGVCIVLFGVIATTGIRMLVEKKVDYSRPVNILLTSVVLVLGISGVSVKIGAVDIKGMALGTFTAIIMNLVYVVIEKMNLSNQPKSE